MGGRCATPGVLCAHGRAGRRNIAGIRADHAQATLDFLDNKFGTAELYDWMSGVLEDDVQLPVPGRDGGLRASAQLAFCPPAAATVLHQDDYWSAPSSGFGGAEPDRRGLTGSARLLQDITQLGSSRWTTEAQPESEKTFRSRAWHRWNSSVFARLGVIVFATPMELFDATSRSLPYD